MGYFITNAASLHFLLSLTAIWVSGFSRLLGETENVTFQVYLGIWIFACLFMALNLFIRRSRHLKEGESFFSIFLGYGLITAYFGFFWLESGWSNLLFATFIMLVFWMQFSNPETWIGQKVAMVTDPIKDYWKHWKLRNGFLVHTGTSMFAPDFSSSDVKHNQIALKVHQQLAGEKLIIGGQERCGKDFGGSFFRHCTSCGYPLTYIDKAEGSLTDTHQIVSCECCGWSGERHIFESYGKYYSSFYRRILLLDDEDEPITSQQRKVMNRYFGKQFDCLYNINIDWAIKRVYFIVYQDQRRENNLFFVEEDHYVRSFSFAKAQRLLESLGLNNPKLESLEKLRKNGINC